MKSIDCLNIGKIYSRKTIDEIVIKNELCKEIFTNEVDAFLWEKEKVKLLQIIDGYESNGKEFNNIKIKYLILEPITKL